MTETAAPLVVDAILFDMDGTLVDSNPVVNAMWTDFARMLDLDAAEVLAFAHGTPSIATLRKFLPEGEDIDAWHERIGVWEDEHFDEVTEMRGAVGFVASLPADAWAVATSALTDAAARRLRLVGFPEVPALIGADQVDHGKPHPECFVKAAQAIAADPTRCVIFEDSPAGVLAGLAAGATVVIVGDLDNDSTRGLRRIHSWDGVQARVTDRGIEILGLDN